MIFTDNNSFQKKSKKGKNEMLIFLISLVLLTILLLSATPLAMYYSHFGGQPFSNDPAAWGQFGDYLNGTFMPIIALMGIIVPFLLGLISERRNESNLKIEQQKQRPLLHLDYFDSQTSMSIFLKNKGNGPLIITNYRLIDIRSKQTEDQVSGIFEILPEIYGDYNNYTGNQNNKVLSINEKVELFLYKCSDLDSFESDNKEVFKRNQGLIRQALSSYKIVVDYKDVYDNQMPTYERSLEWFGRNPQKLSLNKIEK